MYLQAIVVALRYNNCMQVERRYSTDQMQGIKQKRLPSRVNVFVSLYKPI